MMATIRRAATRLRLRTGGVGDLDDVMRIMEAFQPCFGEAWTRSQCVGILPMAGIALTIAEDGRGAVGFSLARCVADEAELLLIAVDPAGQRSGVGQSLLEDFIAKSQREGATKLHLEVREGNPAVAMYRAAGFAPVGRRRNYYHGPDGKTHDAITLMLVDRS